MDGSNGKIIELLERIALGQERLSERVENGFEQVNSRLDNVIEFMGRHHADHEKRMTTLETQIFKKRRKN